MQIPVLKTFIEPLLRAALAPREVGLGMVMEPTLRARGISIYIYVCVYVYVDVYTYIGFLYMNIYIVR